ncbi:MAG: hypothetical protein U1D30_25350 [Planctomycetota bacterium]
MEVVTSAIPSSSGRIVVAGIRNSYSQPSNVGPKLAVAVFDANGRPDASFDDDGILVLDITRTEPIDFVAFSSLPPPTAGSFCRLP